MPCRQMFLFPLVKGECVPKPAGVCIPQNYTHLEWEGVGARLELGLEQALGQQSGFWHVFDIKSTCLLRQKAVESSL